MQVTDTLSPLGCWPLTHTSWPPLSRALASWGSTVIFDESPPAPPPPPRAAPLGWGDFPHPSAPPTAARPPSSSSSAPCHREATLRLTPIHPQPRGLPGTESQPCFYHNPAPHGSPREPRSLRSGAPKQPGEEQESTLCRLPCCATIFPQYWG